MGNIMFLLPVSCDFWKKINKENQKCQSKQNVRNSINILKIREIIFGFGRSGGNFNNQETPKRIERLGPYEDF